MEGEVTPEQRDETVRERSGCLKLFLGLGIILSVVQIVLLIVPMFLRPAVAVTLGSLFILLLNVLTLVSYVAVWNWRKWGAYGLIALETFAILSNLAVGSLGGALGDVLGLAIVIFVVRSVWNELE